MFEREPWWSDWLTGKLIFLGFAVTFALIPIALIVSWVGIPLPSGVTDWILLPMWGGMFITFAAVMVAMVGWTLAEAAGWLFPHVKGLVPRFLVGLVIAVVIISALFL